MSMLPPVFVELRANAKEFMAAMDGAEKKIESLGKKGAASGEMLRQKLGMHMQAAGAMVTGAGAVMLAMGEKLEKSHVDLEVAVRNTGKSYEEYASKISGAVKSGEHFGHTSSDTQEALAILTRATHDTGKALGDMKLVTELAAVKHIGLAEAAQTVAKMHAGAFKPLREFGINIKDNAKAVADLTNAQGAANRADDAAVKAQTKLTDLEARLHGVRKLSIAQQQQLRDAKLGAANASSAAETADKRYYDLQQQGAKAMDFASAQTLILAKIHGTAEAQAGTFGGKIEALKAHLEDMASSIGQKVGPAMTVAGPLMLGVGTVIQSGVIPMVAKAVVSFASMAAGAVASFAAQVAAAATWAAGMVASAAVAMAPFLPWIALVAAIGIAAYELYEHWDTVWSAIKSAVAAAVSFVVDHLRLIIVVAFGPLGLALVELHDHWSAIWNAIQAVVEAVWGAVKTVIGGGVAFVKGLFDREVNGLKAIWDGVWHGIGSTVDAVWSGIKAVVKGGINEVISGIDFFIRAINKIQIHIPSVGIGPFHTPGFDWDGLKLKEIPKLAAGGIVTSPTLALIGEAGPEAVLPLSGALAAFGGGGSFDGIAGIRNQASQIVMLGAFTFGSLLRLAGDLYDRLPHLVSDTFDKMSAAVKAGVDAAGAAFAKGTDAMSTAAGAFASAAQQAASQVEQAAQQIAQAAQQAQSTSGGSTSSSSSSSGGAATSGNVVGVGDIIWGPNGPLPVGATYDDGGLLPPGVTVAHNKTGQDEYVFTRDQLRGRGGVTIAPGAVVVSVTGGTITAADVQTAIERAFAALTRELRSR